MYRRRGIFLIIGLLLIACLAQAAIAAPDGTGNETAGQVVISPTPVVTDETGVMGNATSDTAGTTVTPAPGATPEITVPTVEPTETSTTPAPATTPEVTVAPTV